MDNKTGSIIANVANPTADPYAQPAEAAAAKEVTG
jgi:hypothetical protein